MEAQKLVVAGRQQFSHDRLIIITRQQNKYSLQFTMARQLWCIPDRWWQAVPRMCWSHWEGAVAECWTSGQQCHQQDCVSRAQTMSSVDVICLEKAPSKVRWHCSMKTLPERTARMWLGPELTTNGAHEAMELCILTSDVKLEFFSKSKLESKKSIKTRNLFLIVC